MLGKFIRGFVRKCTRHDRLESTFTACPTEVANHILNILSHTLLFLRNTSDLHLAHVAASHAHNLPDLIRDYTPEKLQAYWEVDRDFFKKQGKDVGISYLGSIELAWTEAQKTIERHLPNKE